MTPHPILHRISPPNILPVRSQSFDSPPVFSTETSTSSIRETEIPPTVSPENNASLRELHPALYQDYLKFKTLAISNEPRHNAVSEGIEKIVCKYIKKPIVTYSLTCVLENDKYNVHISTYNPNSDEEVQEPIEFDSKEEATDYIRAHRLSLSDQEGETRENSNSLFLFYENSLNNDGTSTLGHFQRIDQTGNFINHSEAANQNLCFWAAIADDPSSASIATVIDKRVELFDFYFEDIKKRLNDGSATQASINNELYGAAGDIPQNSGIGLFFRNANGYESESFFESTNTSGHIDAHSESPSRATTQSSQQARLEPLGQRSTIPKLMEVESMVENIDSLLLNLKDYSPLPLGYSPSFTKTFSEIKLLVDILKNKNLSSTNPFQDSVIFSIKTTCEKIDKLISEGFEAMPDESLRKNLMKDIENWAVGNTDLKGKLNIRNETNKDFVYENILNELIS
jgi:hypothetical protein